MKTPKQGHDYSSVITASNKLTYTDVRIAHDQQIIDPDEALAFVDQKVPALQERLKRALAKRRK